MRRMAATALLVWVLLSGCEKDPELPPELQQSEANKPEVSFTATINGPERLLLAGVSLQVDHGGDSATLMGRGASDETVVLTGNARSAPGNRPPPGDQLNGREFEVIGPGKTWLGPTDGIRSLLSRYQVETAIIHIERVRGESVTGRIEGKFWRFDRREPTIRPPTQEQFSGSFTAKLIR